MKSYTQNYGFAGISVAGEELLRINSWDPTVKTSTVEYVSVAIPKQQRLAVRFELLYGKKFKVSAIVAC